ncbi:hypothetical protein F5Y10DRAFT_244586 [Nemania abortiva]|nr:hypothetical protein F5Y10DRAFT_244586 [Nemania abortiva]
MLQVTEVVCLVMLQFEAALMSGWASSLPDRLAGGNMVIGEETPEEGGRAGLCWYVGWGKRMETDRTHAEESL